MYTDILVLTQLISAPGHGYEIKKRVEQALAARGPINDNTLYPLLRRFQEAGYVSVAREEGARPGGPQRNVFSLTDRGMAYLRQRLAEFPAESAHSGEEFHIRAAFMDLLAPENRARIFATRREHLVQRLEQLRAWEAASGLAGTYGAQVIQLQKSLASTELEWIRTAIGETTTQGDSRISAAAPSGKGGT